MKIKQNITRFILIFLLTFASSSLSASPDSLAYEYNPNYQKQINMFDLYKTKQADIVMLGNSITHGVNWNELLGREDVVERGIPGDIVQGFLHRLEYIYKLRPRIVFVMGGINDIYGWIPLDEIYMNYMQVVNELRARNIQVVIQSTLYVAGNYPNAEDRNSEVEKLNELLKRFADENILVEFVDLNEKMSSGNNLKLDLTWDGVHLNANGYKIWVAEVEKKLNHLNIK